MAPQTTYKALWLIVVVIFCVMLVLASRSKAHEWYGWECCSGGDCRPAYRNEVRQTKNGWLHVPSGQVITHPWVKPSRDGEYHVCIPPDGVYRDGLKVKCIYVPVSM